LESSDSVLGLDEIAAGSSTTVESAGIGVVETASEDD
jgi:hypothetical protein